MSAAQFARQLADTQPVPFAPIGDRLGETLESMISIQIKGYPSGWTDAEYRETAIKHLFGDKPDAWS